ncbi:type I restriction endonuclease subunit R [Acinetobacter tandoii]|uniref:Type I restriction enzyme endonuclease subunit n=1 Tax=Acinetobacter tandoii DSM 14970 = CIP 107469 TaxID=1120927 RepID=R9BAW7_9GAMM|nr:type I restriction endonuclease subunit R [Acinetobacter tandoii]EOR09521.1 type I restriction enzyme, R subunit [Acinetobacter tandoii DSM 14970 = CIP 107469]EOR09919.1 type I restriction enzyme, R subunit [Acinetobacter tandoii DSM 14970 = CIP 107469]EOR10790.1 type I restriction enzyme, R subunit [Acinetobacter tandoii DSM 14970 = CIP 107469]EOR11249.1 type I restriction enzyme, R subunit [Acinetobacter tandoii DSM 14970 = CIP 107469]
MSFTENKLELVITNLLKLRNIDHLNFVNSSKSREDVFFYDDFEQFIRNVYKNDSLTPQEVKNITIRLTKLPASDIYETNKIILDLVSNGFLLKREDRSKKDLYIRLIDYENIENNSFKFITQMEVQGNELRIPDGILYINGIPLIVFEFKSAIREDATIYDAYQQLTVRYARDIPELMKYNALCVISDGVNTKMGSLFASYEFFYTWRKVIGDETLEKNGIDSLHTMIEGLFEPKRLIDVIRNFIYFPDTTKRDDKIVCRYPQYYAANKLFENIKTHRKPLGDGKGGTYFGATGCGKSFTMLFLSRLIMKSVEFESPTIVVITDRTDLDDQLSAQFTNAKGFIGDETILSVESRQHLRELLQGRKSGGVFLTTIHKFTEDIELLTERTNVICISDEAHRSQVNLDQKIRVTEDGVKKTYGFAKYLHDSLPNATYVGFTGTPIDATLDVFGDVIDSYTMSESVQDEITVRLVYEGRAAKVLLDNKKLQEIEGYYKKCQENDGASTYAVEESKKAMANMRLILGNPDRIKAIAEDFVNHYETRVSEGSTIMGKAMFVCASRQIAFNLYQEIIALRPEWAEVKEAADGIALTEQERKEIKPNAKIKLIATRHKDDEKALYDLCGTKDDRKEHDRQFKNPKSNFKIAIVVDMWLTGFDVPFLDTIYIDKPIQQHNLIQTISRVNRKFESKEKGLVVDYIGIKNQMKLALAHYNKSDAKNFEDVEQSIIVVKDHLELLKDLFNKFDTSPYFSGEPLKQLQCLNKASEHVQLTKELEHRFMQLVKRLKAAYDVCNGSEKISQDERDLIHFYLAVRSIVFKLTRGDAPDTAQMNLQVQKMIADALEANGVDDILKIGEDESTEVDIFGDDYLAKLEKIKLPNTKIKLLQKLLAKAIGKFKQVNRTKSIDFSKRFKALVDSYNERKEDSILVSGVLEDFSNEIMNLLQDLKQEMGSFADLGIGIEEKAFYDILQSLAVKYDFTYPENQLLDLAKAVKAVVDDKSSYPDWSDREDIRAELKVDLIVLLAEYGYPPIDHDEVYKEIFEQAENFKKYASL